ncbi:MAG TPA: 16S rRNA (cytosine(967)-C(5))-methyltransferase RsmB [Gemmataceae bacterium]
MSTPRQPAPARAASARALAGDILRQSRLGKGFASELLDQALRRHRLTEPDRRLLTELVYGVLRRRSALAALVAPFLRRAPEAIDPRVWDALHLGAYQLAFLGHVPAHAAVSESVELVKTFNPRAAGFVNSVLRRVSELLTRDETAAPAANALPLEQGRYRRLAKDVFPRPDEDPAGYLASAFTLPDWLARRWLVRFGFEECVRLGFWFAAHPPLWLRCNKLRTTREELRDRLAAGGVRSEPGDHPQSLRLLDRRPVTALPGYAEGLFTVQDQSAMAVADVLAPRPGWTVLDLCAAPGGKTTHLAEHMDNRGKVIACDIDADRLRTVASLCERLGVTIVEPWFVRPDAESDLPAGPFDAILVDAPCSNTGVLGRRPEVRHRLREEELAELAALQARLLRRAADRLKPGGVIVYSTCSIEPEENQEVVRAVLEERPELEMEGEHESRPGLPADGGYWARLRKVNRT